MSTLDPALTTVFTRGRAVRPGRTAATTGTGTRDRSAGRAERAARRREDAARHERDARRSDHLERTRDNAAARHPLGLR
ncbi:hypothetical protein [Myceligenerans pegani]|uniref:Uncharacterized protein n=1 Tax=Myceligenerans pegani TaxID=2776917 RepID=A0ABR9MSY8_9MICO|nr:hypothetical protein [Myceligenerans sp. TRM 65318]MBE1874498.1 hypothetical protein [Myceligenerans sp. TRM 65318]MBE3016769.1 hypothetical protein [Myceligenerans sp. TRM 65318]